MTASSDNRRWQPLIAALPDYLARQRWFPAKARTLSSVAIDDEVRLTAAATLLVIGVEYSDGIRHRFALPVAEASGAEAASVEQSAPERVIARLGDAAGSILHDDPTQGIATALLDAIGGRTTWPARRGAIVGEPTSAFDALRGTAPLPARRITGEQSNTSIIFGDRLILKVIRRLEPGLNPDYEIGRHLTDRARFAGVPALAGAFVWHDEAREPIVLAVLQAFVPGAAVLRERIVPAMADLVRAQAARAAWRTGDTEMRALAMPAFAQAEALGRRTGDLHLALADAQGDPAFEPSPATGGDLARIAADMREQTTSALDLLTARAAHVPVSARGRVADILARRDALLSTIDRVATVTPGIARIRVHGDYQLDQVLLAGDDFVIIDFEGEPLRPVADRREKFLALKDVAGMIRSYSYAAYAGLYAAAGEDEDAVDRLDPIARWWQDEASSAFVRGYRSTVGRAPFMPADDADTQTLLRAFIVEKATYELRYELNHRPAWLRIPLAGMAGLEES